MRRRRRRDDFRARARRAAVRFNGSRRPEFGQLAIRATVLDRAKNSATYRAELSLVAGAAGTCTAPPIERRRRDNREPAPASTGAVHRAVDVASACESTSGWTSASARAAAIASTARESNMAGYATGRAPFRLSSVAASTPNDGVTPTAVRPLSRRRPYTDDAAADQRRRQLECRGVDASKRNSRRRSKLPKAASSKRRRTARASPPWIRSVSSSVKRLPRRPR